MNTYENIFIADAGLQDAEIEAITQKVRDIVTSTGGEVLNVEDWGRRKLAYEVNKHSKGYYKLALFNAPSATVKKLEEYYKVTDSVVKFMVIKLGKKERAAAVAALAKKAEAAAAIAAAPKPAEGA